MTTCERCLNTGIIEGREYVHPSGMFSQRNSDKVCDCEAGRAWLARYQEGTT